MIMVVPSHTPLVGGQRATVKRLSLQTAQPDHGQRGTLFMIRELYGWGGAPDVGTRETPAEIARKVIAIDMVLRPGCNPYGAHPDSPQVQRRVMPGSADNSIYDVVGGHCIASEMADEGCRWTKAVTSLQAAA